MANKTLTQEEVWDDSDLVKSWNEAYQEYVKYHSLAAKGEKVDIATLHAETSKVNGTMAKEEPKKAQLVENSGEIDLGLEDSAEEPTTTGAQATATGTQPPVTGAGIDAMPQGLAATVQDEDMKNLMMSWYYAGYYTGLYEGKQQGYAAAKSEQKGA